MNFSEPTLPTVASRLPKLKFRGSCRGFAVCDNRVLVFESHLELMVLLMLWMKMQVVQIIDQPPPVTYVDDFGEPHRHTFDFFITLADGTRIFIAVKPVAKLVSSGLPRKVELIAEQLEPGVADRIHIITDADFTYADRYNAVQMYECSRFPVPEHDEVIDRITGDMLGAVKIADLVDTAGLGGAGFRAVIRLITEGVLIPALPRRRITPDSHVLRRR
jgi:hypothetical protein